MIGLLFQSGKSFSNFPFKVTWIPESPAILQAGVGVSTRYFKKATDRNRIKRMMREAWRLQKKKLHDHLEQNEKHLSIFIIYTGKELPQYDLVYEKTGVILNRLIKFIDEKDQAIS